MNLNDLCHGLNNFNYKILDISHDDLSLIALAVFSRIILYLPMYACRRFILSLSITFIFNTS